MASSSLTNAPSRQSRNDLRILIADDHSRTASRLRSILTSAGYRHVQTRSRITKLTQLEGFDVVLLDIVWPPHSRPAHEPAHMFGIVGLRHLRRHSPGTRVVLMSTHLYDLDHVHAIQEADGFFKIGAGTARVLAVLSRILDPASNSQSQSRAEPEGSIVFGKQRAQRQPRGKVDHRRAVALLRLLDAALEDGRADLFALTEGKYRRARSEVRKVLSEAEAGKLSAARWSQRLNVIDGSVDGAKNLREIVGHVRAQAESRHVPRSGAARRKTDVLLVTVNPNETQALLDVFAEATGRKAQSVAIDDRVYRDLGSINGTICMHALSEMGTAGPGAAHQTVEKGIRALSPGAVIFVGIAFGINEKKQAIGDILLARQLRLYDLQRVGPKIILRGDKPHSSTWLVNYFSGFAQSSWSGAPVSVGVLLTGDKLIDDVDYRDQLLKLEPEAIGGEMEGAGLYVASHDAKVDWIVLKAICDWADGQKSKNKKGRQVKAARSVADFLMHALQQTPLRRNPIRKRHA